MALHSGVVTSRPQCIGFINILQWTKSQSETPAFLPLSPVFSSHLPLLTQVFICLLQPACGLLYYSWIPYCFWLMQNACFPSYTTYNPQTFSSPKPRLEWSSRLLQITAFIIHVHPTFVSSYREKRHESGEGIIRWHRNSPHSLLTRTEAQQVAGRMIKSWKRKHIPSFLEKQIMWAELNWQIQNN